MHATASDLNSIEKKKEDPVRVVDGRWSSWSSWTPCSSECIIRSEHHSNPIVGISWSTRKCNTPSPSLNGGTFCDGNDKMAKLCDASQVSQISTFLLSLSLTLSFLFPLFSSTFSNYIQSSFFPSSFSCAFHLLSIKWSRHQNTLMTCVVLPPNEIPIWNRKEHSIQVMIVRFILDWSLFSKVLDYEN